MPRHPFVALSLILGLAAGPFLATTPTTAQSPHAPADTQGSPQLPPGHPQMTTPKEPAFELPEVPEGSGTGDTGLTWTAPEGWVEEEPANAMRKAQYRLPGEAGDAELVIYYFGPGQGGAPMANCERWAGQFMQPDGTPPLEAMKTAEIEAGAMPVLTCEVSGTYGGGMTTGMGRRAEPQENQMLLGAIAEGPDANWFFKLTGPEATVEGNRKKFEGLIGSLEAGS
jgi:hypothetical protein